MKEIDYNPTTTESDTPFKYKGRSDMKLVIYIKGDQLRHFPSLAGLEESRVKFEAVRLNRDVVRWKLIGDEDILKKYWEVAQRHGVAYGLS